MEFRILMLMVVQLEVGGIEWEYIYPISPFVVAVEMYDKSGWSLEYWC